MKTKNTRRIENIVEFGIKPSEMGDIMALANQEVVVDAQFVHRQRKALAEIRGQMEAAGPVDFSLFFKKVDRVEPGFLANKIAPLKVATWQARKEFRAEAQDIESRIPEMKIQARSAWAGVLEKIKRVPLKARV
jgi:hypothetical protein